MKRILIVSLVLVLAGTACQKQLDLTPISAIGADDFYQNTDEVQSGLVGCYDGLQTSIQTQYMLTEMRSDNTTTVLGEGEFKLIDFFQETPDNSVTTLYWQNCYNTIFRANNVMAQLGVVTNESTANQIKGEALFIRALNYFNLVRLFGNIPLVTTVVLADDNEAFANVPASEVYSQIISDLQEAASLLPATDDEDNFSRATSSAANGLLAKVYITLGQYSNALPLLQSLTTAGFQLMPTYPEVFNPEVNPEIIFSIRFKSGSNNEGQVYSSEFTKTGIYSGLNNPTNKNIESYTAADSVRFNFNITSDLLCGKYLSSDPRGDAGNDWPVLRYADILLLLGETINQLEGPTAAALEPLNQVRERAGIAPYTTAELSTKEAYANAVAEERVHELGFENHRWFDLLRTGQALKVMNEQGAVLGFTVAEYQLLFPIPQREIDVSGGYLVQNPGY